MTTKSNIFYLVALLCLLFTFAAQAETIHVPDDFETIQAAINASEDGDEIIVAPGEYVENIDLSRKVFALTIMLPLRNHSLYSLLTKTPRRKTTLNIGEI